MEAAGKRRRRRGDGSGRSDAAQRSETAAAAAQHHSETYRAEALARLQRAVIADCGFAERLVVFWSNHFCISANKGGLARMWAGRA